MSNLSFADPVVICTTSSIPQITIRELFSLRRRCMDVNKEHTSCYQSFTIPIFQRRFCWEKQHLRKLLIDISKVCSKPLTDGLSSTIHNPPISFGRIVVTAVDDKVIVIDGQQRLTSVCLLLASTRDFILTYLANANTCIGDSFSSSLESLASFCDAILYPSSDVNSCILEPTFFDRVSFHSSMRGVHRDIHLNNNVLHASERIGDHILQAKQFLDETFTHGSLLRVIWMKIHPPSSSNRPISQQSPTFVLSTCASLVQAILDKIGVLYFNVDKTNDVQSVYERLAMREALLAPDLYNSSPGVLMRESDLVRNLITSFSHDINSQIHIYQEYWAPIEHLSICHSSPSSAGMTVDILRLDACVCAYLNCLPADLAVMEKCEISASICSDDVSQRFDPGTKCFPLYQKLQECIRCSLLSHNLIPLSKGHHCKESERIVISLLQDLFIFSEKYFEDLDGKNVTDTEEVNEGEAITTSDLEPSLVNTHYVKDLPCPCFQRGTLCTDCIIKKYAPKQI